MNDRERAERQVRLLLQRYGILVKEWYRREHGLLPWFQLFQILTQVYQKMTKAVPKSLISLFQQAVSNCNY